MEITNLTDEINKLKERFDPDGFTSWDEELFWTVQDYYGAMGEFTQPNDLKTLKENGIEPSDLEDTLSQKQTDDFNSKGFYESETRYYSVENWMGCELKTFDDYTDAETWINEQADTSNDPEGVRDDLYIYAYNEHDEKTTVNV